MTQCIARSEGDLVCGRPSMIFDVERGGMVCVDHAPNNESEIKELIAAASEAAELCGEDECERHATNLKSGERR